MKLHNFYAEFQYDQTSGTTVCSLLNGEKSLLSTGNSHCSVRDNFCKDTGRKVSLGRALKVLDLPKEGKKKIWEAYRTSTKVPRW